MDGLSPVPRNITKLRTPPPTFLTQLTPVLTTVLYGPMYVLSAGVRGVKVLVGMYYSNSTSNNSTSSGSNSSGSNSVSDGSGSTVSQRGSGVSSSDNMIEVEGSSTCDVSTDGSCTFQPPVLTTEVDSKIDTNGDKSDKNEVSDKIDSKDNSKSSSGSGSSSTWFSSTSGSGSNVNANKKIKTKKKSTDIRISEQDWSHMAPYQDPVHISFHTTQLKEVRTVLTFLSTFAFNRHDLYFRYQYFDMCITNSFLYCSLNNFFIDLISVYAFIYVPIQ